MVRNVALQLKNVNLHGGQDPLCDFLEIVEAMAEARPNVRAAIIEALANALHRHGLRRADANALAFNAGRLAERQRHTEQIKTAATIAA